MTGRALLTVGLALLLASGCTELVDTRRFRTPTDGAVPEDAGPPDAGLTDAALEDAQTFLARPESPPMAMS